MQRADRDQRHAADQPLAEHRPVADHPRVALLVEHLRRRPRADERVEAGDRAAGDGDEDERVNLAGDDRPAAVDELRECRRVDRRRHHDRADDQRRDRAELHVRREVVARAEQHPHRQHRGDEAVRGDRVCDLRPGQGEERPEVGARDPAPGDHRAEDR